MRLIDIVSAPWMITPDMFAEVQGIYARHVRGEKIDLSNLEARIGKPLNNVPTEYEMIDGVAVISLQGVLAKRMNLFMHISGGTSTQIAGGQLRQAAQDPAVQSIVLHIDSPGGTCDGTQELASIVREIAAQKPLVAVADGLMASAAYWIGSAASKVYITSDTTYVGSIGVVATHVDYSAANERAGIKTTEITAGRYKRIASDVAPLSREGREVLQAEVDQIYSLFVDEVAKNRGVSVETVLKNMADGRLFIGQKAVAAGLVDGVAALSAVITQAAAGQFAANLRLTGNGGVPRTVEQTNGEVPMTLTIEQVKKEHPDVAKALAAEGFSAGRDEGLAAGRAAGIVEGADQERARIKGVLSKSAAGHEKLVQDLAFDGKTSPDQAASHVLEAINTKNAQRLEDTKADAAEAKVVASTVDPAGNDAAKPAARSPLQIAARAREISAEKAKLGITVNAAEAVALAEKEG